MNSPDEMLMHIMYVYFFLILKLEVTNLNQKDFFIGPQQVFESAAIVTLVDGANLARVRGLLM